MFSLFFVFFSHLPSFCFSWFREEGRITPLPFSPSLLSFMYFIAVWQEVCLVILTFLMRFYPFSCMTYPARNCNLSVLVSPLCRSHSPPSSPRWWPVLSKFLDLVFLKLDLHSSDGPYLPRAGLWFSRAGAMSLVFHCSASRMSCYFLGSFVVYLLLFFMLLGLLVLVPFFPAVPFLDSNSAFTASTLVLLCSLLASIIALCGSLRGSNHLFNSFPTFCNYFSAILIWFESIDRKPTPFSFIRSTTTSFFWIRSGNDHLL
jgi:hypothetical protein